ncbi:MAG: hypothetical protein U0457_11490 [Candidatus Sericytochromatia bacterium]
MIVLSIFSFAVSYVVFVQMTSKVETKNISTSKLPTESTDPNSQTILIGNGQGSPKNSPNAVITPEVSTSSTPIMSPSGSISPSGSPSPSPSVSVSATTTPIPSMTPVPTPTPSKLVSISTPTPEAKKKNSIFKVRVGAFDSRTEAEKKAKDLEALGYEAMIIDEPEGSYVQVGAFKENDKAVSLAEEVSQKGFSVSIRNTEE